MSNHPPHEPAPPGVADRKPAVPLRRLGAAAGAAIALVVGTLAAPASAGKPDRAMMRSATTETATYESATFDSSTTTVPSSDYDPVSSLGSLFNVVDQIGARELWQQGITGDGVDVAVIDTGVAPVPALADPGKVVGLVDLSFEAGVPEAVYLDTFGHGSHMAGIIAGRDPGADPAAAHERPGEFVGVAPDAGIVSVKVGDNTGAVDVSQVIAALDWVVDHRDVGDWNIGVVNLSYTTDGVQDAGDPLFRAVERAWDAGIVVVVAGGNDGWNNSTGGLGNPARNRYVIAVGAAEATDMGMTIPKWASPGDYSTGKGRDKRNYWQDGYTGRIPDVVAPGAHIDSLRVPGSRIDIEHPEGHVTDSLMRGSGSSQAAAVVSGAAALLLDARPDLTPDQVKALLMTTADPVDGWGEVFQGAGVIDVAAAASAATPDVVQTFPRSDGLGSLEASRGTQHVTVDGALVEGEITAWGEPWDGSSWTGSSWTGSSWTGSSWTGSSWTGSSWTGSSWTGSSWTGSSWTGSSWTGSSWTGSSWTGSSWTGSSWTGSSWTGSSWS